MVIKLNRWSWIMVVGKGKKSCFHPFTLYPLPTTSSRSLLRHCISNSPSPVGLDANFAGLEAGGDESTNILKWKIRLCLHYIKTSVDFCAFSAFSPCPPSFMDLVQFNIQPAYWMHSAGQLILVL